MDLDKFTKSETWVRRNPEHHFAVEVKHWVADWGEDGHNRWNVYIYLNPKFRNFEKFEVKIGADIPVSMNWGCTFADQHTDKNGWTYKKYGSDYSHIRQERFARYETPEDAYEVFVDALRNWDELIEYCSAEETP